MQPLRPLQFVSDQHETSPAVVQLRLFHDDAATERRIRLLLGAAGAFRVQSVGAQAADRCVATVLAFRRPEMPAACEVLRTLQERSPCVPVLVITDDVGAEDLIELLASGVSDFCSMSCNDGELLARLLRMLDGLPPRTRPPRELPHVLAHRLIGRSPLFLRVVERVPVLAQNEASILLLGETGTGKEVLAQAIHYCSRRAHGPWVAVNCAAIPADLVESEFFGHVRGAYTHAVESRRGLVQDAEGGTLFLDEIDALPLASQAKLLRFLQERQYRSVGASQTRAADVRIIAASNRDMRVEAETGRFRQDLYFRLAVLSLTLPPLRERREDIGALAVHFLGQVNGETDRHIGPPTPEALGRLCAHHWPGNVRELRHVILRGVLLTPHSRLQAEDIDFDDGCCADIAAPMGFREAKAQAVESFERHYLEALLARSGGNISRAAREAHKNRRAFFELLRRREIDPARYRAG
jgi:DNA-binding NtrC family response regulator